VQGVAFAHTLQFSGMLMVHDEESRWQNTAVPLRTRGRKPQPAEKIRATASS
jgi:hypothetical protein